MRRLNWKPILISGLFLLCLFAWITPASAQSWSNGYANQRGVTLFHSQVPNTDQINFPVLISGTYSYLATTANGGQVTNANGYDIIFTSDWAGTIPLPYERESYNPTTGAVIFWVQVPTLSHTVDTVIYMFYGNSSVTTDQTNKTGVWDSHYKGVWHLPNGSTLSLADSTSNGNNATNNGALAATGQFGGGMNTNGTTYATIGTPTSLANLAQGNATFSAWINTASGAGGRIIGKDDANGSKGWALVQNPSNHKIEFVVVYGGTDLKITSSAALSNSTWNYVTVTLVGNSSANGTASIYLNGQFDSTATGGTSGTGDDSSQTAYLANSTYGDQAGATLNGSADEFRVSNSIRSADWIATEYNNQHSPSSFYSVNTVPNLSSLSPNSGPAGTSVTITGTNFGSAQGSSTVTFSGVTTTPTSWSNTQIAAPVPVGTSTGNVVVNVSNLNSNGLLFTDTSSSILALSPTSGSIGESVTIIGANFGATQGSSIVTFNGTAASPTSWSNNQIVAPVPSGASNGNVFVTVSGTPTNGYNFTVTVPAINTLSTSSGPTGTSVTITGSNFGASQGSSTVTFNGTTATPTSWSMTGIVVPVPAAAATGNVVVTVGVVPSNGVSFSVVPNITSLSPSSGMAGTAITIAGTGFGATQGTSTVTFNAMSATPTSWSNTSIVVPVPTGATTGNVVVSVSSLTSNGAYFDVLPSGWLDQDVGTVGLTGSATYANGTFTLKGAGSQIYSTADSFHFTYQPLSGDGTIVARLVSLQGGSGYVSAGVMIRETLNSGSTNAKTAKWPSYSGIYFDVRTSTGGSTSEPGNVNVSLPYWVKVVRSGSTFSGFISLDGVNWVQVGTNQTISMAQTVYVGLAVDSGSTSALATATFDNVSVNSTAAPAPVITSLSATTGPVGDQIAVAGSGFGSAQGTSAVMLNGAPTTINTWSNTLIAITIPTGATSGPLAVLVGPSMNASNPFMFTVTSQPLPSGWMDQDVGSTGLVGSATYANGAFTVNGAGTAISSTADSFHFAYQPLSGDGSIVARLVSFQGGGTYHAAGIMIRETLAPGATEISMDYTVGCSGCFEMMERTSTGGNSSYSQSSTGINLPYWVKLVRAGNTFSGYISADGVNWTQVGTTQTINMATNVYIGLAVTANSTTALATATFDNVSINSAATPAPVISSLSATTGTIGSQVTISGSNFGASQVSSLVLLNALPMTINSWSNTSITITIASGSASGYLAVLVGPSMNASNPKYFTVTTQPLPSGWLDLDIGSVGTVGSAGYSSGTFTVNEAGTSIGGTADSFHFAYQSLSGDGTIVARLVSLEGGGAYHSAAIMIRETLAAGATEANVDYSNNSGGYFLFFFADRTSTGGSTSNQSGPYENLPYWLRLTRGGNTFTAYTSSDGVYWTPIGNSVTISMATNVYIGLGVSSSVTSQLATATFDNVSVSAGTPYPLPNISGISPTYGGIGSSVTVSGSGFGATQGSSTVRFNGSSATSITSWSDSQIVAIVPSSASTGPVTVVENGVGGNQNVVFTFYNPVISSLLPPAGPVGGSITISGSGFGNSHTNSQGTSIVNFNGVSANISSWSDTSITATVPANATSGPVTITESGITSSGVQFSVIEAATVTGLSPTSGPVGTSVVITGTGFGATQSDSVLFFYGATATNITNWSDTSITATFPAGAASGPVSVTVAGISASGPAFTLTTTTSLSDSLGNSTTYAAEVVGGQWLFTDSQGSGCSTCNARGVIHNIYDSLGNVLSTTDALGNVTTNTYDSSNNLLSQSTPLNGTTVATTSYTYNGFGEVLTVTDPLGNVTTNAYDAHGNLTSVTSPKPNSSTAASVTTFAYNSLGELTTITDPLGHVTTMTYTTAGLVATITDAQNNVTTYGYDAKGNRTSVTDALNHTTTFAYDAMSRLTTITYPGTTTSSFTYDIRGRRTSVTDQNGKTTSYAYDDADRLTSVTDAASHVTYYAYDTEDNLTSITDANSNQTAFTYDAFGRVTQTNFPSSLSENYQYDADNNLTQKTDRKSQTITYLYDALNRLTSKTYPDTTAVDYTYDLVGKIQQVNDPTGTYAFAYDNMGRLIGTTTSYSFLTSRNFANAYTYDAASNRTGFTDPESGSTAYTYDTLNRLTSLAPPSAFGSGSFGFSYDALSRRTQMTRPNSVTTNYSYDNLSRLTSVLHQLSGSTIDGASYTLDSAGNRTAKTDQLAAVTSNYTYDAIYQLTQVTQANNTTESYSYDPEGNRTASLGASSYTTNASNELTATSNASYTYDSNGNTLTKTVGSNTTSYTWDFENRLTSVTLPGSGGTVTFKYDPMGRRIYKSSSSSTSVFAYDGDNMVEETNATGAVVSRYEQTQNIDEPLAMLRSSATSYYNADGIGSVTSLTNSAGAAAETYTYDSFGKVTASSGSLVNPFQYTGRESDPETGLYYYRARYYDQSAGRFIGEDPIRFEGGVDFYAYVGNSPTTYDDPRGLEPEGCKDCQGRPKQGVAVGKSCCGNEDPMSSSAPNPYSEEAGYMTVSAQLMFAHGGDGKWGNLVRGCLVCMYAHGSDSQSAHYFCYLNSAKRAPLNALPGFGKAVGAAGVIWVEQAGSIIGSLAQGKVPPTWSLGPFGP
jgi:RHS repeat-associated protein